MLKTMEFQPLATEDVDDIVVHADDVEMEESERVCRICLESEKPEEMIAPCDCKGTSKWVHRKCLDEWRCCGTRPKAFTNCTECNFQYVMERPVSEDVQRWDMAKFGARMVAEISVILFAVISLIASIGWFMEKVLDPGHDMAKHFPGMSPGLFYGLFGSLIFFAIVGLFGFVSYMCGPSHSSSNGGEQVTASGCHPCFVGDCCIGGADAGAEAFLFLAMLFVICAAVGLVFSFVKGYFYVGKRYREHARTVWRIEIVDHYIVKDLSNCNE